MGAAYRRDEAQVLVAVAFDARLPGVLAAAAFFARRTGASLRLAHVCDPWTRSYLIAAAEAGPPGLLQALKEQAAQAAERRLDAVRQLLPSELRVEAVVLSGDVVRSLAEEASRGVSMVVVGASKGGIAGTQMGYSTAVSLISETTVPVMVVNEAAAFAPGAERLTILVADDFSDVAQAALDLGMDLAAAIPRSVLVHVHVESYEDLHLARAVRSPSGAPAPMLPTPEQLADRLGAAETTLRTRCGKRLGALEAAGGHYRVEVATGSVPDEIERSAAAYGADLAIFGQHRVFHRQTRHVGQVPFKAMLSEDRPVIVVPQRR